MQRQKKFWMSAEFENIIALFRKYPQLTTASFTFLLNLIVTICLIKREKAQFEIRRSNDRKYQSDLFLYQNLIIKEVERYVDCVNRVENTFLDLCEKILTNMENKRLTIEKAQELVDQIDRQIRSDVISKTHVFSSEFAKRANALWDDFYDKSTLVISKLDRVALTIEVCHKHRNEMNSIRESFLRDLFKVIKDFHPLVA
jgi:hypothetical protein